MRSIFKKNPKDTLNLTDNFSDTEIIEAIHEEVYSAQDLLLKQSESIINKEFDNSKIENIERLKALGFISEKNVKDHADLIKEKQKANDLKKIINYYSNKYLNKFIDEKTVEEICNKYGLLLTTVDRFIGAIPEKNQQEIFNFKFDSKDKYKRNGISEILNLTLYDHFFLISKTDEKTKLEESTGYISGENLMIIATKDLINTQGMRVSGYQLIKDDPIVLQPVNGGYLIVSAWGPEASDSKVINVRNN